MRVLDGAPDGRQSRVRSPWHVTTTSSTSRLSASVSATDEPFTAAEASRARCDRDDSCARWPGPPAGADPAHARRLPPDCASTDASSCGSRACGWSSSEECVVTDRTAAWLLGAATCWRRATTWRRRGLVFSPPGHRLRNELAASGERRLVEDDVVEVGGLRVTTAAADGLRPGSAAAPGPGARRHGSLSRLGSYSVPRAASRRRSGSRATAASSSCVSSPRSWIRWRSRPGRASCDCAGSTAGLPRAAVPGASARAPGGRRSTWTSGCGGRRFAAEYDGAAFHGHGPAAARRRPPRAGRGPSSAGRSWSSGHRTSTVHARTSTGCSASGRRARPVTNDR